MRKMFKKLIVGACLLLSGFVTSCDNSFSYEPKPNDSIQVQLARTPDVVAWSGEKVLGSTFGTRTVNLPAMYSYDVNVNQWAEKYQCENATKELSDQDIEKIKELLSKGTETYNKVSLPWPSYFVQQVYKGESTYYADDKDGNPSNTQVTGSNQMDKLVAWNGTEYEHINNFNYANNTNNASCSEHNHLGTTLMTGMPTENIDPNKQFGYHETWGNMNNDRNEYHYIIVEYNGDWYVGFDYHAECSDRNNPNEGKNVNRDWNFTDWIVRISPAYPKDYNGDLWENDLNNSEVKPDPNPEQPEQPEKPEKPNSSLMDKFKDDHVEINLSIEERDYTDYLSSHLSIHVRAITNVKVFIPIPLDYVCRTDDLEIVKQHKEEFFTHGGPETLTYNIGDNDVTLNIEYVNEPNEGIMVWTEGINEDVINYCKENYGDGITFEIWNYFNITKDEWNHALEDENGFNPGSESPITVENLRKYLNDSKVWFTNNPSLYVNAFMYEPGCKEEEHTCDRFIDDCIVTPQEYTQKHHSDYWYNGSPYNELYVNSEE